jgi:hypothetical protein
MKANAISFQERIKFMTLTSQNKEASLLENPLVLQRLEGLVVFLGGTYAWTMLGGAWWLFLLLLLTPDVSMIGYLVNARVGAAIYNLIHSYTLPALSLAFGLWFNIPVLMFGGILVLAHIGMDRTLGYGLKFGSGFRDTHLGKVGRG